MSLEDPISGRGGGEAGMAPWTGTAQYKYFYFIFYRCTKPVFVFLWRRYRGQYLKSGLIVRQ